MTFLEVGFQTGSGFVGAHPMTDDIAAAVRAAGGDPNEYNQLLWPIGASRYARGLFLLHADRANEVVDGGSTGAAVLMKIGPLIFDRMTVRASQPQLVTEGSGAVVAVEVVDERFGWQGVGASVLRNVSTDDKAALYDATEGADDSPYFARDVLGVLFNDMGVLQSANGDVEPPTAPEFLDESELRDWTMETMSAAAMVDRILAQLGHVLVAYPSPFYSGSGGFSFRILPIGAGEAAANAMLEELSDELIGGGMLPVSLEVQLPADGAAQNCRLESGWADSEVPASVRVAFPLASESASYQFAEAADSWVTDRWHIVTSTAGRPAGMAGGPPVQTVHSTTWAIRDTDGMVQDLQSRADDVARRFYSRFQSGAGHMLFRGIQQPPMYAGAQEIIWSWGTHHVTTRIRGRYDHELFGFDTERALTASDIMSTGLVRAIPRPGGGILLDSPAVAGSAVHPALITEVFGGPVNATYSAEAIDVPAIMVSNLAPINRPIDPADVDWTAAEVGDQCLIVEYPQEDGGNILIVWEVVDVVGCPVPLQSPEEAFFVRSVLGAV